MDTSPRAEGGTVAANAVSLAGMAASREAPPRLVKKVVRLVGSTMVSTAARWATAKSKALSGKFSATPVMISGASVAGGSFVSERARARSAKAGSWLTPSKW